MAFVKLATVTTIQMMSSIIRMKADVISEQESGIEALQMDDIIHRAFLEIRGIYGSALYPWYWTDKVNLIEDTDLVNSGIDISAVDPPIADFTNMVLKDTAYGRIPIRTADEFEEKRVRRASDTRLLIATVKNLSIGGDDKVYVVIHRGSGVPYVTPHALSYVRLPKKTLHTDADPKVDWPESLVPFAEDLSARIIIEEIKKKTVPASLSESMKAHFARAQADIEMAKQRATV